MARAEHVGGLLRPSALQLAVRRHVHTIGSTVDIQNETIQELNGLLDDHIRDAIAHREACGLDVVTDGEFRAVTPGANRSRASVSSYPRIAP